MNHLKWMGHATTIFDIQKNLHSDSESCDVTIVAGGHTIRAHRFVLSSCSDLMRTILTNVPVGQDATIMVPDIKGALLESVIAFIYIGETCLSSTNLSDFLEAINLLGIKSAISFECNTAALAGDGTNETDVTHAIKSISGLQIVQEELIDQDKLEAENVSQTQATARDLEFLEVYSDPQNKISYSIEQMPVSSNGQEFILTENSGTFTLTQNTKLENSSTVSSEKLNEIDDDQDGDDSQMIDDYGSSTDPIIEINNVGLNATTAGAGRSMNDSKIKVKSLKIKRVLSAAPMQQQQQPHHHHHQHQHHTMDSSMNMANTINITSVSVNNDEALEMSVRAVLDEGLSLQKAAQKFDVSKTVLWRRVRKHPNYMKTARENPVLSLAYERLKAGDSLKNISRDLDIPMSTLHRHKVRLAQQGRLPEYITFKKRDHASKEELREKLVKAVHACVHEGMSQNHAANLYDIPKSTLWRHLQKRVAEAELSQKMEQDQIKEEIILS